MVKDILEMVINFLKSRIFSMALIVILMFSILMFRIFDLQIVNEEYYLNNYIQTAEKEVQTSGTRGLIFDRNGTLLAYNKLAYAIEMEDVLDSSLTKSDDLNRIIDKTVQIIQAHGDDIINEFSIILNSNNEYEYSVSSENEKLRFLRDIYGKKSIEELDDEKKTLSTSSAAEVMDYLCGDARFDISDEYDLQQKLYIAMIRYRLSLNSYQKYITTKIASNVSEETVAAIYENQWELAGVSVTEESIRVYNESKYFAHIIGYTGKISESQLADYNGAGGDYLASDVVGKSGIEQVMESDLQGQKGISTIFTDSTGRILEQVDKSDAKAGNDVYLSVDAKLQKAGYTILEQKLAGIVYNKLVNRQVTVTENMKEIPISIYDVYYQMINNNVLDLSHFAEEDAKENEKNIYNKFQSKQQSVIATVRGELTAAEPKPLSQLSEEYNTYLSYIYSKLLNTEGIIDKKSIDTEDATYIAWEKETISFQQFLYYAISKNWINTSKLYEEGDETKYSDSDEIYQKLLEHIFKGLSGDAGFSKKIYYYMINDGIISGNEICMALFDQGVLDYNEASYQSLKSGGSAYEFMREQIRLIKITPAQIALDPCSGSIVVTDVNTGDVLALVTYPSYDNNMLSGSVDAVYWSKLNNDLSLPLYNRATQTRTAPGSTFKMISAITGLEQGIISPGTLIADHGEFTRIKPSPKCWRYPGNHGSINVSQALGVSCNYFFYEVGYQLCIDANGNYNNELGLSKIKQYADQLGITSPSGVEIEENEPLFSKTDAVRSAIGQGSNSYSNVQLARYVTTLANRGNNYQLTLLEKVVDSSGTVLQQFEPELVNKVEIKDSTWNAVFSGMRSVVTTGTARGTFSGFPIEVAGKSGTAQENLLRSNHSTFVAFAPYSNPEIGVSVVLPHGESSGYNAEVVREMIKYYYHLTTDEELYGGVASIPTSGITSD